MRDTLPAAILADLAAVGRALLAVIEGNADGSLAALEAAVETVGRETLPRLLAGVITATQTSLQPGGRVDRNRIGIQIVTSKPMRMQ